jgi:hypothetical protein
MHLHPSCLPHLPHRVPKPFTDPYIGLDNDEFDDGFDSSDGELERREKARRQKVRAMGRRAPPPPRQGGKAQTFGAWGSKEIVSSNDFTALEEAVYASDDNALRYYIYLNTKFQQDVGLTRTPGVTRLLQRFGGLISGDAMRARYLMTCAAKPPKARRGRTSSQAVPTAPILPAEDAVMAEVPSAEASSDS